MAARAGRWAFFEIDPLVERIAHTPGFFSFLRDCPPSTIVVIGDGKLSLARTGWVVRHHHR
jgi:hypothetical protein